MLDASDNLVRFCTGRFISSNRTFPNCWGEEMLNSHACSTAFIWLPLAQSRLIYLTMKSLLAGFAVACSLVLAREAQQGDVQAYIKPALAGALDAEINQAVQSGLIPGAVLIVGRNGKVFYRKAYGLRALIPNREPMTVDTIFDAASLTFG